MDVSIITPSVREDGLCVVREAIVRQTFPRERMEWVVVSPFKYNGANIWLKDPPKENGMVWTLNRAYNLAIQQSTGKLIISWQDFTSAKPDTIEQFWYHFEDEPKTLVTAVGNKYESLNPLGRMIWRDPRERSDMGNYYPSYACDIEANLCSVPREAFYAVGGFDEELDKRGFGMDFYSVTDRLQDLGGWDFKIDQSIKSYSLEHGRLDGWEENNLIHGGYQKRKEELKTSRQWPVLSYLQRG